MNQLSPDVLVRLPPDAELDANNDIMSGVITRQWDGYLEIRLSDGRAAVLPFDQMEALWGHDMWPKPGSELPFVVTEHTVNNSAIVSLDAALRVIDGWRVRNWATTGEPLELPVTGLVGRGVGAGLRFNVLGYLAILPFSKTARFLPHSTAAQRRELVGLRLTVRITDFSDDNTIWLEDDDSVTATRSSSVGVQLYHQSSAEMRAAEALTEPMALEVLSRISRGPVEDSELFALAGRSYSSWRAVGLVVLAGWGAVYLNRLESTSIGDRVAKLVFGNGELRLPVRTEPTVDELEALVDSRALALLRIVVAHRRMLPANELLAIASTLPDWDALWKLQGAGLVVDCSDGIMASSRGRLVANSTFGAD